MRSEPAGQPHVGPGGSGEARGCMRLPSEEGEDAVAMRMCQQWHMPQRGEEKGEEAMEGRLEAINKLRQVVSLEHKGQASQTAGYNERQIKVVK